MKEQAQLQTLWEDLHELAEVSYKEFETTACLLKSFKDEGFFQLNLKIYRAFMLN